MKRRTAKPLRTELISCISVTVCLLSMPMSSFSDVLGAWFSSAVLILMMIFFVVMLLLDVTKGTKEELEREERDERNLMLQDQASWFCWRVENVLLLAGMVLLLAKRQFEIINALYLLLVLRYWLLFLSRWWMSRHY